MEKIQPRFAPAVSSIIPTCLSIRTEKCQPRAVAGLSDCTRYQLPGRYRSPMHSATDNVGHHPSARLPKFRGLLSSPGTLRDFQCTNQHRERLVPHTSVRGLYVHGVFCDSNGKQYPPCDIRGRPHVAHVGLHTAEYAQSAASIYRARLRAHPRRVSGCVPQFLPSIPLKLRRFDLEHDHQSRTSSLECAEHPRH